MEELLAAADPVSICRALLGFAAMRMVAQHGSPDRAVAEIDQQIRKVANGNAQAVS